MTLASALAALGWSDRELARRVGCGTTTANRWAAGQCEPPDAIVAWVADLARYVSARPAPRYLSSRAPPPWRGGTPE